MGLDENGESVASMERRQEERSGWPLFGIKEMKIESCDQQASASEEDYDEESMDE